MSTAAVTAKPKPAGAPANGAPPPRMALANVQTRRVRTPPRTLLYGPAGIGKTTWGAGAPAPIILPVETGSDGLDVARFPQPTTLDEVLAALRVLLKEQHEYQTLVVDSIDAMEPLIWRHVCREAGVTAIEDVGGGYGKGYTAAMEQWLRLLKALETLREAHRMRVVLIGHSMVRTAKNPTGADFDRHQLRLNEKAAAKILDWCDDVLFATLDVQFEKVGKGKWAKAKAVGGTRRVFTQTAPGYEAKNRHSLPPSLPLDFGDYLAAVERAQPVDTKTIEKAIETLVKALDDDGIGKWVAGELARKPAAARLAQIRDRLAAKMDEKERAEQEARDAAGEDDQAAGAGEDREPGQEG